MKLKEAPETDCRREADIEAALKYAKRGEKLIVRVGRDENAAIIGRGLCCIAGPCAVENEERMLAAAAAVKAAGADILRGGAFKPRTSPYDFQGLGADGLRILRKAGDAVGLPVVSEIVSPDDVGLFCEYVDMIQVGARNMDNYELLRALGHAGKPVLLKRGAGATIAEWLLAAEYIMSGGNENVVLCERGIRTFEPYTRNTLDVSAIAAAKKLSRLPVLVDPSHSGGRRSLVRPLAAAGVAAGADGFIIECSPDPDGALCDGGQTITPDTLASIVKITRGVADACAAR